MSLIPPFQIGVWNVWIVMLYSILILILPNLIFNKDNLSAPSPQNETEKRYRRPWVILFMLITVYSVFLPLKTGTTWFYVGLPICLLGLIAYTITAMNIAKTPICVEPVTRGLYRYSRHPMYLTIFLMLLGAGIASASWIFILFAIVSMILWIPLAILEEQFCLEQYGNTYREYMNKAPRWIGILKS